MSDIDRPSTAFGIGADVWPGLAKVAEEAAEVIQIIAKLISTGGETDHWSGMDLKKTLEDELGDLHAAIAFTVTVNPQLHEDRIFDRATRKVDLFHDWHEGIEASYKDAMEGYV